MERTVQGVFQTCSEVTSFTIKMDHSEEIEIDGAPGPNNISEGSVPVTCPRL